MQFQSTPLAGLDLRFALMSFPVTNIIIVAPMTIKPRTTKDTNLILIKLPPFDFLPSDVVEPSFDSVPSKVLTSIFSYIDTFIILGFETNPLSVR